MANVMTFATRSAFDTALATGGSIATILNGVTAAAPSVSVIAHVTESGETFGCGTNVMLDIKSAGLGDYVVYDSTNHKFFVIAQKWIDNNYPAQPTQQIMKINTGVLPARYEVLGTVGIRDGKYIMVVGFDADTTLPQTTTATTGYDWTTPLTNFTTVEKKGGGNKPADPVTGAVVNNNAWCALPSLRLSEKYFSTVNTSYWPILRSTWDAAIIALNSADPAATITITVAAGDITICPAAYGYDYDRFMAYHFSPLRNPGSGCYTDHEGLKNTVALVNAYLGQTDKDGNTITRDSVSYAAGYCYNKSKNAPGFGKHQWYLPTIEQVGRLAALTHTFIVPKNWNATYYWSSTQYSKGFAWHLNPYSYLYGNIKYNSLRVVPCADLILNT